MLSLEKGTVIVMDNASFHYKERLSGKGTRWRWTKSRTELCNHRLSKRKNHLSRTRARH